MNPYEYSANHRVQVLNSAFCGCFHCLTIFQPSEIIEWCDKAQTAICPHCNIDAIIGSGSGHKITDEFLNELNQQYFRSRNKKVNYKMTDKDIQIKQLNKQNQAISNGAREFALQMQILDDLVVSIADIDIDTITNEPLTIALHMRKSCCDLSLKLAKRRLDYAIANKLPVVRNPDKEAIWQKHCQEQINKGK